MSQSNPYLFFDGRCAEAMQFYAGALRGTLQMMKANEAPAGEVAKEDGEKILHARLEWEGGVLMASDWMAPSPFPGMHGFAVALGVPTVDDARRLYDTLSAGGKVSMEFTKTFYSDGFAMFSDRFGMPWMVMAQTRTRTED